MAFKIKIRRVDQIYTDKRMGHTYEDLKLRRRAFDLFSKGMGYKNVAMNKELKFIALRIGSFLTKPMISPGLKKAIHLFMSPLN